ncbi:MAG: TrkH family potassium uptake protein [Succinivibrio sp.]|nr:TrkH family potassium uptake protein [Succinivibrio sp.]
MVVNLRLVSKLLSPAICALGVLGVIPALYAQFTDTPGVLEFSATAVISIVISVIFHYLGKKAGKIILLRELFLFTALLWFIMTLIAAVPFYLILDDIKGAAAIFESASGLSTTGATVIDNLDDRPPAILLWRSILQYLGGIGFVVVAVAVLPNIAMGGMNLFKTESTSFDGKSKITPHIKTMAFTLLAWYIFTLIACIAFYIVGGFTPFVAVNAALCTVSTGGMMPYDDSMNNAPIFIQYVAIVFMLLGSIPFLLILGALAGNSKALIRDQQVQGFFFVCLVLGIIVSLSLWLSNNYDVERAFRTGFFNVIAILSSTGFNLEDFTAWNSLSSIIFLLILGIGGCSGSTAGGIKLFRLQICFSMFKTQIVKSIHPHMVCEPRFNRKNIDSDTLRQVITYLVAYLLLTMASAIAATCLGLDITDALTATVSALSNIGPAIGPLLGPTENFSDLSSNLHLLFALDMILGRLEILPVLLCLTKMFWSR